MLSIVYLLAGGALLWKGGDWIVDGADRFARGKGMPASLAGVFILGFATSAPELATTVMAALAGHTGIASGNVVGSNIANVALILGVAASIHVIHVDRFIRRVEMPIGIVASLLVFFLFLDGEFSRTDGGVVLLAFAAYFWLAVRTAGRRPVPEAHHAPHRPWMELLMVAAGLAALVVGARLFLVGAVDLAASLGVSQLVIGLTLVALGTSLPELATTVAAARKGHAEMAIGNIVGSNIFNLLLVLGVAGLTRPQVDTDGRLVPIDLPVMIFLAVLMWFFSRGDGRLRRWEGVLLLTIYAGYVIYTGVSATR